MKISLDGRTAIVTGASSGIGADTAQVMARCGARVVAVGRDEQRLNATVNQIRADGGTVEPVVADLRDASAIDAIVDAAGEVIDILSLAAGHFYKTTVEETTAEQLDDLWAVHVRAPFGLVQRSLPRFSDQASVLFYSSTVIQQGFAPYAGYTAVKGAVDAMARALAVELQPRVRVNTIVPGFTATPMCEDQFPDAPGLEEGIIARTPVGFLGGPTSAAHLAALVSSDAGSYINGARLVVDGGWTAQGWQVG